MVALGPHLRTLRKPALIHHHSRASNTRPNPTLTFTLHLSRIMADNVGLTTPRGSGTSGYVQKNRSLLRPRDKVQPYPKDWESAKHRPRQPDAEILEHEAKRDIEVKVLELRDKLEDEGVDEDEIEGVLPCERRAQVGQRAIADYEEGSHWRKQEERMRDSLAKREAEDEERTAKAKEARRYDEGDSD